MRWELALGAALIAVVPFGTARASERHFTSLYESDVLGPDQRDFEPATTARLGRADFYRRLDERLELEFGLTDRLQTALYLNFSTVGAGPVSARTSTSQFEGISSEWKLKLTDPVADPAGSALYVELTASALDAELEGKLILDKRAGPWLAAVNLVGEEEWDLEHPAEAPEAELQGQAGVAYLLDNSWSFGLEARVVSTFGEEGSSVLFAGPTVTYASKSWWAALSLQPQLVALSGATDGGLNLADHERLEARLLLGFRL